MGKDKRDARDKDIFQKVLRGTRQNTPSAAERREDDRKAKLNRDYNRKNDTTSRNIRDELAKQARAEQHHRNAEEERRKRQ